MLEKNDTGRLISALTMAVSGGKYGGGLLVSSSREWYSIGHGFHSLGLKIMYCNHYIGLNHYLNSNILVTGNCSSVVILKQLFLSG